MVETTSKPRALLAASGTPDIVDAHALRERLRDRRCDAELWRLTNPAVGDMAVRHDDDVKRVSVVGNAGSGKTGLAERIAATLGVPHIELDAIHHLPGWEPMDPNEFVVRVGAITSTDGWVIDGNYRTVVVDGPVWQRADTVVWLDLRRRTVMRQVTGRTVRRILRREELWNGNREPLRNLWAWDPDKSVIRWAWTQHAKYQDRYGSAMASPSFAHIDFVRLRSHEEVERWLERLRPHPPGSTPNPRAPSM